MSKLLREDYSAGGILAIVAAWMNLIGRLLNNITIDGNPALVTPYGIELRSSGRMLGASGKWSGIIYVYGYKYYSPLYAGTQLDGTSIGDPPSGNDWIRVNLAATNPAFSFVSAMTTPWGDNIRYRNISNARGDLYVEC